MTDAAEAERASAALNGTNFGGRQLNVNEARPKAQRSGRGFGGYGRAVLAAARSPTLANPLGSHGAAQRLEGKISVNSSLQFQGVSRCREGEEGRPHLLYDPGM